MADPLSRSRRTWPQRLVITVNAVGIVAALVTAAVLGYANTRLGEIDRIALSDALQNERLKSGDPQNYLIVGVDDASGLTEGDSVRNRPGGELNSDTIMILRIDPEERTARLLSIPRDLRVPISGTDSSAKINAALPVGGPRALINTIFDTFEIPIHHYVQVDFAGFSKLVEIIDGVPVYFPEPARSRDSGLDIPEAGCWTLGPRQALGLTRARKDYQVFRDGRWRLDLGADYARINRQQIFIQLALKRAIAKGARNPNTLRRLVDLAVSGRTVQIDDALRPEDLVALGNRFRSFNPDNLVKYTVPTTEVGSYLEVREADAEPILAIFRGVAPPPAGTLQPSEVSVLVRNGTSAQGQAGDVSDDLGRVGFATQPPDNEENPGDTVVRFGPGTSGQAQLVARYVAGPVTFEQAEVDEGTDVVLVTGADWQGVLEQPKAASAVPAPSTSTTAPPTTTTALPGASTTAPTEPVGFLPSAPPPGADCPATE